MEVNLIPRYAAVADTLVQWQCWCAGDPVWRLGWLPLVRDEKQQWPLAILYLFHESVRPGEWVPNVEDLRLILTPATLWDHLDQIPLFSLETAHFPWNIFSIIHPSRSYPYSFSLAQVGMEGYTVGKDREGYLKLAKIGADKQVTIIAGIQEEEPEIEKDAR